jgi:hypothetical protein
MMATDSDDLSDFHTLVDLKPMSVKKGDAVCAVSEKLANSLEAQASDSNFSPYIFETKGEILEIRGDYALVKFSAVSTPNVWLRVDQLAPFGG